MTKHVVDKLRNSDNDVDQEPVSEPYRETLKDIGHLQPWFRDTTYLITLECAASRGGHSLAQHGLLYQPCLDIHTEQLFVELKGYIFSHRKPRHGYVGSFLQPQIASDTVT